MALFICIMEVKPPILYDFTDFIDLITLQT